jgi:hypothetical protein
MTTPSPRPRTALAAAEIVALFAFVIGLIQGFVHRTTPSGTKCGSMFGDSVDTSACESVLAAPTAWTWILLVGAAAVLAAGWVIDTRQKNASMGAVVTA